VAGSTALVIRQLSQFQKSVVVVPAKNRIPVFSALFWVPTFAGVTLFNSFEISSVIKKIKKTRNFFIPGVFKRFKHRCEQLIKA